MPSARVLLLRGGVLVAIVVCLVVASEANAMPARNTRIAQNFSSTKGYYYVGDICFGGEAAIADQPPQLYVSAYTAGIPFGCVLAKNVPAGALGLKWEVWWWSTWSNAWVRCRTSEWRFNASATSYMKRSKQWTNGAPCGSHWYNTRAFGKLTFNGTTHKGKRWSGKVYWK